jgi:hypothetical protein
MQATNALWLKQSAHTVADYFHYYVQQVGKELQSIGLPSPAASGTQNVNARDASLISSVLCAGLYPNVAQRAPGNTNFKTIGKRNAVLHS